MKLSNLSQKNLFGSPTHIQYQKFIRKNHTTKSLDIFDIVQFFNDYITNDQKSFDLYLLRGEIKLDFNILTPHNKTNFYHNTRFYNLKR